jgi:hypothetical protein
LSSLAQLVYHNTLTSLKLQISITDNVFDSYITEVRILFISSPLPAMTTQSFHAKTEGFTALWRYKCFETFHLSTELLIVRIVFPTVMLRSLAYSVEQTLVHILDSFSAKPMFKAPGTWPSRCHSSWRDVSMASNVVGTQRTSRSAHSEYSEHPEQGEQ